MCVNKKEIIIRIYLACVFICLVSLFTQESTRFGFAILELDFKTSRQVGTLSILSHLLLFFCCCFFVRSFSCLFVCCFFFKKNVTIISLLTLLLTGQLYRLENGNNSASKFKMTVL